MNWTIYFFLHEPGEKDPKKNYLKINKIISEIQIFRKF